MPLLRITHQRGAFSDAQKAQLAEALTSAILVAEVGADTPAGRSVAYVLFDEVDPATSWFVGGKPDLDPPRGGRFLFDVVYPVGASPQADKTALHATINAIVAETFEVDGSFPHRAGDWVLVHEVPDGNWGASGVTIGVARSTASPAAGRSGPSISSRCWPHRRACATRTAIRPRLVDADGQGRAVGT